jgi:hypothetical protein
MAVAVEENDDADDDDDDDTSASTTGTCVLCGWSLGDTKGVEPVATFCPLPPPPHPEPEPELEPGPEEVVFQKKYR